MQEERIKIKPTIYKDKPVHKYEIKLSDKSIGVVKDTEIVKVFKSDNYNFYFNKKTGEFIRWGIGDYTKEPPKKIYKKEIELFKIWVDFWGKDSVNFKDFVRDLQTDGDMDKSVPELVDMEISEICHGVKGIGSCKFCYKSNVGHKGNNMSLETFKKVFHKLPPSVTQIAFGIGDIEGNPDFFEIAEYTRSQGVIPNVTINGDRMRPELYDKIAETMGATPVSVYDKDVSYNAVKELTDRGMTQVNIHQMISEETYNITKEVLKDKLTDPRLEKLNAIVLLSLKPKGRAIKNNFNKLNQRKFNDLFKFALDNGIGVGFDSCSAAKSFNYVRTDEKLKYMEKYIEPCESSKFSAYVNVHCDFYPCSFSEGEGEWKEGISVINCVDFLEDIWYNKKTRKFGEKVKKCRKCNIGCPIFDV